MVRVKFHFADWQKNGVSILETEEGQDLSIGNFHPGAMFTGTMDMDLHEFAEIKEGVNKGFTPVFTISFK